MLQTADECFPPALDFVESGLESFNLVVAAVGVQVEAGCRQTDCHYRSLVSASFED